MAFWKHCGNTLLPFFPEYKLIRRGQISFKFLSYFNLWVRSDTQKVGAQNPDVLPIETMFYQTFLSPQVKRCVIISYKHGMYKLPHELPKNLILRKLGNIRRVPKSHKIIT